MKTRDGVYKDIAQSTYIVTNGDIELHFSSEFYMNSFLCQYKSNREKQMKRMMRIAYHTHVNYDSFFDLHLYKEIEKRGFFVKSWSGVHNLEELEMRYLSVKKDVRDWVRK